MAQKLLVVTAGTVAAAVGQIFLKQVESRPSSGLQAMVRYIDTIYLPGSYSGILTGEWFPMGIDPQFMDAIQENLDDYYPQLKKLLYPGLLPETTRSGGGGIRYNGAGAVIVNRDSLKQWLKNSITDLTNMGDGSTKISVALVVSAVGATGSGSLERLIDVVVDAAQNANVPIPLHCDVFILQPGIQTVTDLGIANTLALYAEMAAARLSQTSTSSRRYQGRTIMVGWGSERALSSITQLEEAAATLIRLVNDPESAIAAEYQQRAVDNHVLLDRDPMTLLPSHLSSATAVTISLGDLEEQIVKYDAARLLDTFVFGSSTTKSLEGQSNTLYGAITNFLNGKEPLDRYERLLERLSEGIDLESLQISPLQMKRVPANQQAGKLRGLWEADTEKLVQQARTKMQERGEELATQAITEMLKGRLEHLGTGCSLVRIRNDYEELRELLAAAQKEAQRYTPPESDNKDPVQQRLETLERAGALKRQGALEAAIGSVQWNLYSLRLQEANTVATDVLKMLARHCAESLLNLNVLVQRARRERDTSQKLETAELPFQINIDHPLHMAALSGREGIREYYDLVSVFAAQAEAQEYRVASEAKERDPLADFRRWLDKQGKVDVLFKGGFDQLSDIVHTYVRQSVHEKIAEHSVLDVLLQGGEDALYDRLSEAATKAHALVRFSEAFAPNRREVRHISACYRDEQRGPLQRIMGRTFRQGECTLIRSSDPTEIAIFYYVDGLPMSAVKDLTGRCLDAFLKRRLDWHRQMQASNRNGSEEKAENRKVVGVPVFSGKDAQELVCKMGVIRQLYSVRERGAVSEYRPDLIPELGEWKHNGTNGASPKQVNPVELTAGDAPGMA